MIIRPPQPSDYEQVRDLLVAAALPVEDFAAEHMVFVAEEDGNTVGAIGLEHFGETGLLRSLVVAENLRSGGAGRKLVAALERHAAELGEREVWLLTTDADRYFAGLGFVVRNRHDAPMSIRSTAEFSGLCPGDAVLMSKRLQ